MSFLHNPFKKKQPEGASNPASSSGEPPKPTPPSSRVKQVQGILVLTGRPLGNSQTLLQQIVDQQRTKGYSIAPNFVAAARVGDFNDKAYLYATIRTVFSKLGGADLMERTTIFPFQASDGNSGNYYIVFDHP